MDKKQLHELVGRLKSLAVKLEKTPTLVEFVKSGESRRQIDKVKFSELCKLAGLEANKHSQTTQPIEVVVRPPKILALDIETAPIMAYVWGLWENNVALNQIHRDWFVLSFCAKFVGEDVIYYEDQRDKEPIENDKETIEAIHKLILEADILLTHNGDKFDLKKLNARFIYHGLDPIPPKQSIDTLKVARKFFAFTSNKLEYLAKYLGCAEKSDHKKFSGFSMWSECLKNNLEAYDEMMSYNIQDVETLIQIYEKLAKYDHTIHFNSYYQQTVCICGSKEFMKDGFRITKNGKHQIFRCHNCGKTYTAKENLIDKDIRKGLFK